MSSLADVAAWRGSVTVPGDVLALRDALEAELVLLEEIFSLVSGKLAKLLTFVESVGLCVVVKA